MFMKKLISSSILVFLLILTNYLAPAQSLFTNYTCTDNVSCVCDAGDYFYALSPSGIVKFKKSTGEYTVHISGNGLTGTWFNSIKADKNGFLWVITGNGLFRYDGTNWQNIELKTKNGLKATYFSKLFLDSKNRIWLSFGDYYNKTIGCYDGLNWKYYYSSDSSSGFSYNEIAEDRNGNIWLCGRFDYSGNNIVSKIENDQIKTWYQYDGLPEVYSDGLVAISIDSNNNVWVGNYYGAGKFDGNSWQYFKYNQNNLLKTSPQKIITDRSGKVWFCEWGLCSYDGTNWEYFDKKSGISYRNFINYMYADSSNTLWIATDSGVTSFSKGNWKNYPLINGLDYRSFSTIVPDSKGGIFVTTSSGTLHFDGSSWKTYIIDNSIKSNYIQDIVSDNNNNLWVLAGQHGVDRFDGKSWTHYPVPDSFLTYLNTIALDPKGQIWLSGYRNGLCRFDGNKWELINIGDGLDTTREYYKFIFDSSGNLWVNCTLFLKVNGNNTSYSSLYIFDGQHWDTIIGKGTPTPYYNYPVDMMTDKFGVVWILPNGRMLWKYEGKHLTQIPFESTFPMASQFSTTSLASDVNGNIWISVSDGNTHAGLIKYDGSNWTYFPASDGIPSGQYNISINKIYIDKNNIKWLGTNVGLVRFNDVNWKIFTTDDGLINNVVNSVCKSSDGTLWCGNRNYGLSSMINDYTDVEEQTNNEMSDNSIQITPNPASDFIRVNFKTINSNEISINIFNELGISIFQRENLGNDKNTIGINTSNLPFGTYFCNIKAGSLNETKKFIVIH
jgi:ligand-binding sensor domain-containing protein